MMGVILRLCIDGRNQLFNFSVIGLLAAIVEFQQRFKFGANWWLQILGDSLGDSSCGSCSHKFARIVYIPFKFPCASSLSCSKLGFVFVLLASVYFAFPFSRRFIPGQNVL